MKNIKQSLGFCLLLALLSMATIATAQTPAQPSVGEILNTDGTLRLERDGGYSLDGYELQMDASGAPRVVPKGEAQTENTTSGTWGTLGTSSNNGLNGPVSVLAVYNNELYVGGAFTFALTPTGNISANRIAQWTATSSSTQEPTGNQPKGYSLLQNYPNPFNPTTVISYQLTVASTVSLKVYDVLGKEVMTLVNARQAAGSYTYTLNASNLASGVYFYRLQAGSTTSGASSFVQTKKMLLVK